MQIYKAIGESTKFFSFFYRCQGDIAAYREIPLVLSLVFPSDATSKIQGGTSCYHRLFPDRTLKKTLNHTWRECNENLRKRHWFRWCLSFLACSWEYHQEINICLSCPCYLSCRVSVFGRQRGTTGTTGDNFFLVVVVNDRRHKYSGHQIAGPISGILSVAMPEWLLTNTLLLITKYSAS